TPGQSWARLTATSPDWERLARNPVELDWDRLAPDPRTPAEILEELARPRPVIPRRRVEPAHTGFWNGELRYPGLAATLKEPLDQLDQLYRCVSAQQRIPDDPAEPDSPRVRHFPLDTDGHLPSELDEA